MKKFIITFLILAMNLIAYSQSNFNCKKAIGELILKIENEYPGFEEKTKNKIIYDGFKEKMERLL